jgi:hypothetical protein
VVTRVRRDRQAQLKGITCLQHDGPLSEPPNAYFRSLQIGEDTHVTPMVARLSTDVLGNLRVIGLCPVTEIEAKDIDARSQQATNHVLTLARGPHRRHNFSAA